MFSPCHKNKNNNNNKNDDNPHQNLPRQKSAILKHFGLTEKTDPKSVVKSMRRKLRVYGRQANHTLLDRVFSGQLVSTIVCDEVAQI